VLVDEAAESAGRDPADIRRVCNVSARITDGASEGFLQGPVSQWVEELTALVVEQGMDTIVVWPEEDAARRTWRFAEEVAPACARW